MSPPVVDAWPMEGTLRAVAGDPFAFRLVLLDSDGDPVDVSLWTWAATVTTGRLRLDFGWAADDTGVRLWLRGDETARLPVGKSLPVRRSLPSASGRRGRHGAGRADDDQGPRHRPAPQRPGDRAARGRAGASMTEVQNGSTVHARLPGGVATRAGRAARDGSARAARASAASAATPAAPRPSCSRSASGPRTSSPRTASSRRGGMTCGCPKPTSRSASGSRWSTGRIGTCGCSSVPRRCRAAGSRRGRCGGRLAMPGRSATRARRGRSGSGA